MTKAENDYQYTLEKRIVDLEADNRRLNFYKQDYGQQFSLQGVFKPFYCHYKKFDNELNCKKSCAFCKDKEKELQ